MPPELTDDHTLLVRVEFRIRIYTRIRHFQTEKNRKMSGAEIWGDPLPHSPHPLDVTQCPISNIFPRLCFCGTALAHTQLLPHTVYTYTNHLSKHHRLLRPALHYVDAYLSDTMCHM